MKFELLIQSSLIGLIAAITATPATAGRESKGAPSVWAVVTDGSVRINNYFFGAGFEASEGFVLGSFDAQENWTVSGVDLPFASISDANPYSGMQHLRLALDASVGPGASRIALSPEQPALAGTASTVYVRVRISDDGGADYHVLGQAPSQDLITWRVKFSWSDDAGTGPGTIYVLDNSPGGLAYVNTGVQWAHGAYKELRVDYDPGAAAIRYYYDGALIHTGSIVAGTAVEQVGILHDNWQQPNETADFDALSVQTLGEPPVAVKSMTWGGVKALLR